MFQADPATTTPAAPQPDVSETLRRAGVELSRSIEALGALTPTQLALNTGLSVAAVVAAALVIWLARRGRDALQARATKARSSDAPPPRPLGGATLTLITLFVLFTALWAILRIWGVDPHVFAESTATGGLVRNISRAALVITLAVAAMEFIGFALDGLLARLERRTRNRRRAAQLRTVTPLMHGVANALIIFVALSMVLSLAGVEIAPLIAGAGVAGIAIGFGAQTIVKDFLTGVFLIVEDIVSRGDIVEINGFSGTVEDMTLRTIRLRDADGTLHIFPYGEAQVIHNKTRIYAFAVLELQISFLSDIDRALEVIEAAGETIKPEKAFSACILAPTEILGVDKITDNAVIVKARIKVQAGEQWRVAREFHKRAKKALDQAGILIAHRHLPVPPFETIADKAQT